MENKKILIHSNSTKYIDLSNIKSPAKLLQKINSTKCLSGKNENYNNDTNNNIKIKNNFEDKKIYSLMESIKIFNSKYEKKKINNIANNNSTINNKKMMNLFKNDNNDNNDNTKINNNNNTLYKTKTENKINGFNQIAKIIKKEPFFIENYSNNPNYNQNHNNNKNNNNYSLNKTYLNKNNNINLINFNNNINYITNFLNLNLEYENILNLIGEKNYCYNNCINWYNIFITCNFTEYNTFNSKEDTILFKNSLNLILFCVLVLYYFNLFEYNDFINYLYFFYQIISKTQKIFLLLCEYLINQNNFDKNDNNIIKFKEILSNKIERKHKIFHIEKLLNLIRNDIKFECNETTNLLNDYSLKIQNKNTHLYTLYSNIKKISLTEIQNYFLTLKLKNNNNSNNNLTNYSKKEILFPFLKHINLKKENILILDLDETLIHFTPNLNTKNKGIIQYRPGLFHFLETLFPFFEMIIWTNSIQEYADPIIDTIEKKGQFFVCRLYRDYSTMLNDNKCIKDLNNLGKNIEKIIIVDDFENNFSFQKENGILIKPFMGTDFEKKNDTVLIDLLSILLKIIKEFSDVRDGIKKYKNEIKEKITINNNNHHYKRIFINKNSNNKFNNYNYKNNNNNNYQDYDEEIQKKNKTWSISQQNENK